MFLFFAVLLIFSNIYCMDISSLLNPENQDVVVPCDGIDTDKSPSLASPSGNHLDTLDDIIADVHNSSTRSKPMAAQMVTPLTSQFIAPEANEKKIKCDFEGCNRSFARIDDLTTHERTHTGEKPYKCHYENCKKAFSQSSNLTKHMRTHTGIKPYPCPVCGKSFAHSSHLKDHIRIHTRDKRYQCSVCDEVFITASRLKDHKRIHTKDKPYKCDDCKKTFSQSGTLNRHKVTHKDQKPYKCDQCDLAFNDSGNLLKHKRRIHKKRSAEIPPEPSTPVVAEILGNMYSQKENGKRTKLRD